MMVCFLSGIRLLSKINDKNEKIQNLLKNSDTTEQNDILKNYDIEEINFHNRLYGWKDEEDIR